MDKMKLAIIIGSVRDGRFAVEPAKWIEKLANDTGAFDIDMIDVKDLDLPTYEDKTTPSSKKPGEFSNDAAKAFADRVKAADAYIVVAAEYNHSFTPSLKNAFDTVFHEWAKKPIGFVSYGTVGGARAVEHLRGVVAELSMVSMRTGVHIIAPWMLRNEDGSLKDGALTDYEQSAKTMLDQLIWWSKALKAARD